MTFSELLEHPALVPTSRRSRSVTARGNSSAANVLLLFPSHIEILRSSLVGFALAGGDALGSFQEVCGVR
jgi:hypothetical protein